MACSKKVPLVVCDGAFVCVCVCARVWYFLLEKEQSFEKPSDDSLSTVAPVMKTRAAFAVKTPY